LQLLSSGAVNAETLVTTELDISQWEEGYQHIKGGDGIKVLLRPID
jgi:L-iditol 2-dehydrogenase